MTMGRIEEFAKIFEVDGWKLDYSEWDRRITFLDRSDDTYKIKLRFVRYI